VGGTTFVLDLQVWRVAWNVTGTVLASSGDDGCVRLWKGRNSPHYVCVMLEHDQNIKAACLID